MNWLEQLFSAQLVIAGSPILWRELIGNAFGFAYAIGAMQRRMWSWPIGITGNLLLFTVFFGVAFANPQEQTLWGQAARQVFFIIASLYGWWRWARTRDATQSGAAVITPRWASASERLAYCLTWAVAVVIAQWVFATIGAGWPAPKWYFWCDAWIFVGSIMATYAMARGWNDFWLMWIAVDIVGVPLLWHSKFYPSAVLYAVYAALVLYGFTVWLKASRDQTGTVATGHTSPAAPERSMKGRSR